MSNNTDRAGWAEAALKAFCAETGNSLFTDADTADAIADLIGNLLHFALQNGVDPKGVAARGIGMFAAEVSHPEPERNAEVRIEITL